MNMLIYDLLPGITLRRPTKKEVPEGTWTIESLITFQGFGGLSEGA